MSNSCGGGSVSGADGLVVAVGMIVTSAEGYSICFAVGDCGRRFVLIVGREPEKVVKRVRISKFGLSQYQGEASCAVSTE